MSYKKLALDRCEILREAIIKSDLLDLDKRILLRDVVCITDCVRRIEVVYTPSTYASETVDDYYGK